MNELKVTSAEEYAALKSGDNRPDEKVKMPSGAVFRLRRADIEGMALIGELPQSLVNAGLKAWKDRGIAGKAEPTDDEPLSDISADDAINRLILIRQTVIENCLEPRIGFDEAGVVSLLDENGKGIAKLQKADFLYAFQWMTYQEGGVVDGLRRFRNRHERRAATAGSNRKKLRPSPVGAA